MTEAVLAQQELLDHYKFPRNKKTIENPDFSSEKYNPSCGDRVSMAGTIQDGVLTDVCFDGTGCVLSLAAASMLTEQVQGKTVAQVCELDAGFMQNLVGIAMGPTRLKCALLCLEVLQRALPV